MLGFVFLEYFMDLFYLLQEGFVLEKLIRLDYGYCVFQGGDFVAEGGDLVFYLVLDSVEIFF